MEEEFGLCRSTLSTRSRKKESMKKVARPAPVGVAAAQ